MIQNPFFFPVAMSAKYQNKFMQYVSSDIWRFGQHAYMQTENLKKLTRLVPIYKTDQLSSFCVIVETLGYN